MSFRRPGLRYGTTPPAVTPFHKDAQAWDERIGTPRAQARNWRLLAFGALGISFVLVGGLVYVLRGGVATPYVVEIDTSGAVRAIGLAQEHYRPTDAQIAYHLARFVEQVRGLSIDPIIVRANWLKAYDTVTDKAALTLNEHAREHDPFGKVGQRSVIVDISSIVRASEASFQVRWSERSFDNGLHRDTRTYTGLFSILLSLPRTGDTIRKNPLGIYITAFNWSPDVVPGEGR